MRAHSEFPMGMRSARMPQRETSSQQEENSLIWLLLSAFEAYCPDSWDGFSKKSPPKVLSTSGSRSADDSITENSCRFSRKTAHFAAGTQALSGAAISEFGTSVVRLTCWSPAFFLGTAWKTT